VKGIQQNFDSKNSYWTPRWSGTIGNDEITENLFLRTRTHRSLFCRLRNPADDDDNNHDYADRADRKRICERAALTKRAGAAFRFCF